MDLFENGQNGNRVDGRDESREEERIQQGQVEAVEPSFAAPP